MITKFVTKFENNQIRDHSCHQIPWGTNANPERAIVKIKKKKNICDSLYYPAIAPPGSYIDVNDYSSALELAEELKRLSKSQEEYLNFFRWKAEAKVLLGEEGAWGCSLCKSLQEPKPTQTYQNLGAWWVDGGNCQ